MGKKKIFFVHTHIHTHSNKIRNTYANYNSHSVMSRVVLVGAYNYLFPLYSPHCLGFQQAPHSAEHSSLPCGVT